MEAKSSRLFRHEIGIEANRNWYGYQDGITKMGIADLTLLENRNPMSIRVAVVEDEASVREQLTTLLMQSPGFELLGAYQTGEEALAQIPLNVPDVVLMDLILGEMSGTECTFKLKRVFPQLQIVILSAYNDREGLFTGLRMGASGYLLKNTPPAEILKAIQDVYAGGAPMSGSIARQVVDYFAEPPGAGASLSPREQQVITLVAKGYINKEIADLLGLTPDTVHSYLKSIYEKLEVRSRTEAVVKFFGSSKL